LAVIKLSLQVLDDKRSAYVGNRVTGWEHFAQGLSGKAADLTLNWPERWGR
jgi:hypothetical protein